MGSASPGRGRETPTESSGNGKCPSPDSVRTELDRILASASFRGSPPLRRFLRYTVEHSLHGEADQLKEYRLGLEVFGRRSSYEPQKDPIVRLEARRLRAKLLEYYEDEGRHDPVRINVPKGGYAATFAANGHAELTVLLPAPQVPLPTESVPSLSRKAKIATAAICTAMLLLVWALIRRQAQMATGSQAISMAVLPFQNLSGDPTRDYLADGITENLIGNLSRLPGLRVIAPSTSFRYKDANAEPQRVGRDLQVSVVLTGKLLERDDTLVAQIELVDAAKGSVLWDNQYSRKLSEMQSVQEDISRDITRQLRLQLTGEQLARLVQPQTESSEAFQLYLRGRYNLNKRTEEAFIKAIEYFDLAIDQDPQYALAYAGRADSYLLLAEYTVLPSKEALPKARDAAARALELDETLAEAHTSLGAVRADYQWDWRGAESEFRRAIELNPSYATAHQWYAELLSQQGRHDEAISEIRRAQELDPLSLIVNAIAGRILLFAGRVDPAIEQLQKTLEIDPNFSIANYDLGKAYLRKQMLSQAIAEFQKSVNLFRVSERDAALGYAYANEGKDAEARDVLRTYLRQSERAYVSWYGIAFVYTGLREKDQAFACLEKAYQQHDVRLRDVKVEPLFENLRSDPRFVHLVRRVGL
jgi:TolB-like protein/tetratricopeptide (TPR) repeat protein